MNLLVLSIFGKLLVALVPFFDFLPFDDFFCLLEQYMLSFVGCVNISVDASESQYFDKEKNVLNFRTYGDDFGM